MRLTCEGAFRYEDEDGPGEGLDAALDLLGELPAAFRRAWPRGFARADGVWLRFRAAIEGPEDWVDLIEQLVQEAGDDAVAGSVTIGADGARFGIEAGD